VPRPVAAGAGREQARVGTATAAPGSPVLELAAAWEALLERLEGVAGRLRGMTPTGPDESGAVVLMHPPSYNWAIAAIRQSDSLPRIEGTLSELLGRRVSVRFQLDEQAAEPERPRPALDPEAGRNALEDPLVSRLLELFDARTLRVEADPDATAAAPTDEA
jgi:DNA polymerase-3 subunit gamma/tau